MAVSMRSSRTVRSRALRSSGASARAADRGETDPALRRYHFIGALPGRSEDMRPTSPPRRRRALIVEDEILIALDLEDAMSDLGFEVCPLASSDRGARSLAMRDQPDIALVDVCLEGGREPRAGCAMCTARRSCSSPPAMTSRRSSASTIACRARRCWRSRSIAMSLRAPSRVQPSWLRSNLRPARTPAAPDTDSSGSLLRASNQRFLFAVSVTRGGARRAIWV